MTSTPEGVPHALLHNLKHNKVLHARIILLTIKIADVPFVQEEKFCLLEDLGQGFHRLVLNYGFMQPIDVPEALTRVTRYSTQLLAGITVAPETVTPVPPARVMGKLPLLT